MTDTEKLREQFEAWARKNELEAERHKYADDQYDDHAATSAWWAWRDAHQAGHAAAKAETAAPVVGRWYFVTNDGAATTLCVDEADARESAAEADLMYPRMAPHRAVQLVPADQLAAAVDAEREKCAGIVNELRMECARRNMPESATMLWHAEDAIRAGAKEHGE